MKIARFYIRLLLALSLMGWVQFVFAEAYYWKSMFGTGTYSSPLEACKATHAVTTHVDIYPSGLSASCMSSGGSLGQVHRSGDSCPENTSFNFASGSCEPPPSTCESKAGQSTTWSMLRPDSNGLGSIEYACMDSCRLALGNSQCVPASEGATTGVCFGTGTFNGSECQPGDNPTGGTPPTDPPDPTDPPPECGPGYSWSGTTCVKDEPEPCDPSTGEVCPPPDEECDPATETCPPDEGDGDGDGGDGDGDGSGDGDGEGDGDGTGEGDGDGEEPGECDPKTDPNQCKKTSVAGEACEAELKCEGDVIQCAILRKNKEQLCAWDYATVKAEIETAVAGESYQLVTQSVSLGNAFSEGSNGSRWLSAGCPASRSFSVSGSSFSLSWQPVCDFASTLSYIIVAMAGIFFAVYVGRGLGGQ
jgi:hypothetical protein